MTSVTNPLQDSLKQIVESLQARFLLPSIILVVGTLFIFQIPFRFTIPEHSAILICSIITISYLFNALNGLIIRLMEGYECSENPLYRLKKIFQQQALNKLNSEIELCDKKIDQIEIIEDSFRLKRTIDQNNRQLRIDSALKLWRVKKAELLHLRNSSFPPENILPTKFGNVIKAFEHYPKDRYNIDAIALWPRMFSVLKDRDFLQTIHNEKITLDFLANTGFVFIIFSLECIFSFLLTPSSGFFLIVGIFSMATTLLLFYAATAAARDWGVLVCSAFDLYRYDLYKALNLPKLKNQDLEAEKAMWGTISEFIIFGKTSAMSGFQGFDYSLSEKNDSIS